MNKTVDAVFSKATFEHNSPSAGASLASLVLPSLSSPELEAIARLREVGAGVPLENIAASWWSYGRGISGTDGLPVGGYVSIVEALKKRLVESGKVEIVLASPVTDIADGRDGVVVKTDIGSYLGKTVISTIPLGVLQVSPPRFNPALDKRFLTAIQRTEVGILEKIILSYKNAWWPDAQTVGSYTLLPTPPHGGAKSALEEVLSQTTLLVINLSSAEEHPTLQLYLGARAGRALSAFSQDEITSTLHTYLTSRLLPSNAIDIFPPTHVTVTRWKDDPFARGATSSPVVLKPSARTPNEADTEAPSPLDFITLGRSTWDGRLGFAGEHTDVDGRGSVVGAVNSGNREGARVVSLLGREAEVASYKVAA